MQQTFITVIFVIILSLILAYVVVPFDSNTAGETYKTLLKKPIVNENGFDIGNFFKYYFYAMVNIGFMILVLVGFMYRNQVE